MSLSEFKEERNVVWLKKWRQHLSLYTIFGYDAQKIPNQLMQYWVCLQLKNYQKTGIHNT